MNKKLLTVLIVLGSIGLVTAAWYFVISGTSITEVISPAGYRNIALDFDPMTLDTTNSTACQTQSEPFIINKDMSLLPTITEVIQDDSAGECLDYENDCSTTYQIEVNNFEYEELVDGVAVNISAFPNTRYINKTVCCEAYSCPTTRTSEITITQVA